MRRSSYRQSTLVMSRQLGLSLVELMISMALGLVLLAGVWQIFSSSSQAYRMTDSLAILQENMRFTLSRFQFEGRIASYKGCLIGEPNNLLDTGSADYVAGAYIYDNRPVFGWEADGTGVGDAYENEDFDPLNANLSQSDSFSVDPGLAGDILPGSDVLMINNANWINVNLDGNPTGADNALETDGQTGIVSETLLLVVSDDCTAADIFQKSNDDDQEHLIKGADSVPGNLAPAAGYSAPYSDDASVYEYNSTAFFVGMGTDGEPALFIRRLDPADPFGNVELVQGVENMQVLYGLDTDGDQIGDAYTTANNVGNWANVVSVRIALLMRSPDGVRVDSGVQRFNLLSTEVETADDQRARLLGTITIGIRNRLE